MSSQKIIFALFALLLLVLFFSLGIGRYEISYAQIFEFIRSVILNEQPSDEQGYTVFMLIRLPRVLLPSLLVQRLLALELSIKAFLKIL